jgi:DNA-binding CsgD family transcriptional regulator
MYLFVLEARARLQLLRGEPQEALQTIGSIDAWEAQTHVTNPSVLPVRSRAALALAALGDQSEARRLVQKELQIAQAFGAPRPLGIALRTAGLIEGGPEGIELLKQAVDVQARGPAALEHARALVDLGALLRRNGHRSAAREPLRTGMDLAHRFGAAPLRRQAYEELVITGARPRRPALWGVEALTPSERRVAEMAGDGKTNRQIAEELFVTLRTVEAHLSRAYDKLDIASRTQLRAALAPTD